MTNWLRQKQKYVVFTNRIVAVTQVGVYIYIREKWLLTSLAGHNIQCEGRMMIKAYWRTLSGRESKKKEM